MGNKSKFSIRVASLTLFLIFNFAECLEKSDDLDFILSGVTKIEGVSGPGIFTMYGEAAFPICVGETEGNRKPIIAGIRYGDGRIVAYGHTSLLFTFSTEYDNARLLRNVINWVGNSNVTKVGLHLYGSDELEMQNWLPQFGITPSVLPWQSLSNSTYLRQFDVLLINNADNWGTELDGGSQALLYFLSFGGGLILGATPWSHAPPAGQLFRNSFWGNKIIGDMGILFVEGGAYHTIPNGFNATQETLLNTHAGSAMEKLEVLLSNSSTIIERSLTNQLLSILRDRVNYASPDEALTSKIIREFSILPTFVPTKTNPVSIEKEKSLLLAHRYFSEFLNELNNGHLNAEHPSAIHFPGAMPYQTTISKVPVIVEINTIVPKWATALNEEQLQKFIPKRIHFCWEESRKRSMALDEIVDVDANYIAWQSTGLYAVAGSEINVQILNSNPTSIAFQVQIGAHTDDIQRHDDWHRCPQIVYRKTIYNNTATLTSPFGGLVFINVLNVANESYQISISGGAPAPSFALGKTSLSKWRNEIRFYGAPWGELVGKNLILTVSNRNLKHLDNPEELIVLWDHILDAIADLAAIPRERIRPERILSDVQISAGYMHSGYPIMGFPEHEDSSVNFTRIKFDPSHLWGHFHELGHNHQKSDWSFSGTGEVTCNLFALYVIHNVCGYPTHMGHEQLEDAAIREKLLNYIDNGKQFSQWQQKPWTALITYIQLQERFGWSAYKRVFAKYLQLPNAERPGTDQQKIDMWMVMFSLVVEENLTPFFKSWGFPITEQAELNVIHLPETTLRIL